MSWHVVITAAAVGMLMGVAEVYWAYLLPDVVEGWRSVLPTSIGGLGLFAAAACATDVFVAVAVSLPLWRVVRLIRRVLTRTKPWPWGQFVAGWLILAGAMCYLYVAWMTLFVLPAQDSLDPIGLIILGLGVAGALLASLAITGLLSLARRRLHRISAVAAWGLAVALVFILTLPAFGRYRESEAVELAPPVSPGGPRPNILLVTLDTLRFDYLGCYGNEWIETPALDALAAAGVLFEQAIAQAPTTGPSHCSIMTGVYPPEHGAWNARPMIKGLLTIADVLGANGYETVAFTASTTTRSTSTGLQQGFERYVDSLVPWSTLFSRDEFQNLIFFYLIGWAQNSEVRGEVVSDRALAWLEERSTERPFFAWLHYFDPHSPYGAPEPYCDMYRGKIEDGRPMSRERERYAAEITYTDAQLGKVLTALKEGELYDDTVTIVTSDHGEAFGETHGRVREVGHTSFLYDTTQRVPLLVRDVGGRRGPLRVGEQVALTDIFPTILRRLQIDLPAHLRGKPINELLEGRLSVYPGRHAHAFSMIGIRDPNSGGTEPHFVNMGAVRTAEWKHISVQGARRVQLYNLVRDPQERENLGSQYPVACQDYVRELAQFVTGDHDGNVDPSRRLAPTLVRQLKSLGYVGGDVEGE